jgi:HlyD family secretion protein
LFEEVITLVIHQDKCREIFHFNLPDSFHTEFGIFHTFDALNIVLRQDSSRTADRAVAEVASYIAETYLLASADGEVTEVFPKEGELVGTGAPIMNIARLNEMWVTFNVREDFLKQFSVGGEIKAYIPALEKEATFKVTYMKDLGTYAAWKATKTTGQYDLKTFEVKAKPVQAVENLRPGMSAICTINK